MGVYSAVWGLISRLGVPVTCEGRVQWCTSAKTLFVELVEVVGGLEQ